MFFLLIRSCNYPNSDRIITEMKEVLSNLFHKYVPTRKERKEKRGEMELPLLLIYFENNARK